MPDRSVLPQSSFKMLFCQRYACSASEFEEQAFKKTLYGHARVLAPVFRKLSSTFFDLDFKFIRDLGNTLNSQEATEEAVNYRTWNRKSPNFWRTRLKIRISGRKAVALANELFAEANQSGGENSLPVD